MTGLGCIPYFDGARETRPPLPWPYLIFQANLGISRTLCKDGQQFGIRLLSLTYFIKHSNTISWE